MTADAALQRISSTRARGGANPLGATQQIARLPDFGDRPVFASERHDTSVQAAFRKEAWDRRQHRRHDRRRRPFGRRRSTPLATNRQAERNHTGARQRQAGAAANCRAAKRQSRRRGSSQRAGRCQRGQHQGLHFVLSLFLAAWLTGLFDRFAVPIANAVPVAGRCGIRPRRPRATRGRGRACQVRRHRNAAH